MVAIVDRNGIQNDRFTHQVMDMSPIIDKWSAFGWETYSVDGHNTEDIENVFNCLNYENSKPKVIIADTVKGKGVSFIENVVKWHHKVPTNEEYELAVNELDKQHRQLINE